MVRAFMVMVFLAFSVYGMADTYYVPDNFSTIQAAIADENVLSGDVIIVRPGTYYENLTIAGKNLTLKSEAGVGQTMISGDGKGSVISFGSGVTNDFVLQGFTITDGVADKGAGIYCSGCAPSIKENSITGNLAVKGGGIACNFANPLIVGNNIRGNYAVSKLSDSAYGAGIYTYQSKPNIMANVIQENYSDSGYGVGICCELSTPSIRGNLIIGNEAVVLGVGGGIGLIDITEKIQVLSNYISYNKASIGGGIACYESEAVLTNNQINGNVAEWGGGIFCNGRTLMLMNCTITQNTATSGNIGGGVYCLSNSEIKNTIVWNNSLHELFGSTGSSITYSLIESGFPGTGNVDGNPRFADPANDDFHLTKPSICINAGDRPDAPGLDIELDPRPYMGTVDIGCDEYTGEHYLNADAFKVHLAGGDAVEFQLKARPGDAGRQYILLGSISGTWPGTPMPLGMTTLRLNWDYFTQNFVLVFINTYYFENFMSHLDGNAEATAVLNVPALPGSALSLVMEFAYVVGPIYNLSSNPVPVKVIY